MRLLITGGRDFDDRERLTTFLNDLHRKTPIEVLIHGAARGADRLAASWAFKRRVRCQAYPADWDRGRGAGIIRNAEMLTEGRPDLVVAFPGGRGTADMVRRARAAGVPVIELGPFDDLLG